jgi:hypothetical protein
MELIIIGILILMAIGSVTAAINQQTDAIKAGQPERKTEWEKNQELQATKTHEAQVRKFIDEKWPLNLPDPEVVRATKVKYGLK